MASNYNLVIDSKYNPFSYEELLRSLTDYTNEYNNQMEILSALDEKAATVEGLIDKDRDKETSRMYQNYADSLRKSADELASRGLQLTGRRDLMNLRRKYSSDIIPIQTAFANRSKMIEEQAKGKLAGTVYEKYAKNTSLDDWVKNLNWQPNSADTKVAYNRLSSAMDRISKTLTDYKRGKNVNIPEHLTFLKERGMNITDLNKELGLLQQVMESGDYSKLSGTIVGKAIAAELGAQSVDKWDNKESITEFLEALKPAVYSVLGADDVNLVDISSYLRNKEQQERQLKMPILDPRSLYSAAKRAALFDDWEKYKKYFKTGPDGKILGLTEEGEKEFRAGFRIDENGKEVIDGSRVPLDLADEYGASYTTEERKKEILKEMEQLSKTGLRGYLEKNGGIEGLQKLLEEKENDKYDAYRRTEYYSAFDSTTRENATKKFRTAIGSQRDVREIDWDDEKQRFIETSEKLDGDLSDYTVVGSSMSPYGICLHIEGKDGRVKRILSPDLHEDNYKNIRTIMKNVVKPQWDLANEILDSVGRDYSKLTEGQKTALQAINEQIKTAVFQANTLMQSAVGVNSTNPEKYDQKTM